MKANVNQNEYEHRMKVVKVKIKFPGVNSDVEASHILDDKSKDRNKRNLRRRKTTET